jgi:L-lactate dehydrogenase complex protein LldG
MSDARTILTRVREALRNPAPKRHLHGHGALDEDRAGGPDDFRAWLPPVGESWSAQFELFRANSLALKAEVVVYRDLDDLAAQLRKRATAEGWKKLALARSGWSAEVLGQLPGEKVFADAGYDRGAIESCDVGVTECDALVAQTGSVLVTSGSAGGRVLSVLPPHHVVLARHDQLVPDLTAALARARDLYREAGWPSMLSFITGPSRTGDIERILVLGAHGPKRLTIFCDQPV